MSQTFSIVGCHRVPESCFGDDERPPNANEWPYLIVVRLPEPFAEIEFGVFTQKIAGEEESNWQAVKDEIELLGENRAGFFFHCIDWDQPLSTPYGEFELPEESPFPKDYLQKIVYFWD